MARYRAPQNKIESFLGLSRRAGTLVIGRSACRKAIRAGQCRLLIVARGAGASIERDAGATAEVAIVDSEWTKEELGQRLGRSSVAVLGMTDADMARGLLQVATPLPE